jgi:lipooligosaccharide transport system ATP-binding protein
MDSSRIIARGTPRELIESVIGREVVEVHFRDGHREEALAAVHSAARGFEVEETHDVAFVFERDGQRASDLDLAAVEALGGEVVLRKASLEDVFLRLTGRELIE